MACSATSIPAPADPASPLASRPTAATVTSGGHANSSRQTVTGSTNTGVTWTATRGIGLKLGLFTAPTVSANTTVTVTANQPRPIQTQSASAAVVVTTPPPPNTFGYAVQGAIDRRHHVQQHLGHALSNGRPKRHGKLQCPSSSPRPFPQFPNNPLPGCDFTRTIKRRPGKRFLLQAYLRALLPDGLEYGSHQRCGLGEHLLLACLQ